MLERSFGGASTLPLYEYQCPKDGTFEKMRKFSDPPLTACPTCGGPIEKLLSAPAIQFKGTGWYITDYARKSGGGESAKESGESAKEKSESAKEKSESAKEKSESAKEKSESAKEKSAAKESKDSSASSSSTPSTTAPDKKATPDKK
jgi:putative FmdB family regulatory protein